MLHARTENALPEKRAGRFSAGRSSSLPTYIPRTICPALAGNPPAPAAGSDDLGCNHEQKQNNNKDDPEHKRTAAFCLGIMIFPLYSCNERTGAGICKNVGSGYRNRLRCDEIHGKDGSAFILIGNSADHFAFCNWRF